MKLHVTFQVTRVQAGKVRGYLNLAYLSGAPGKVTVGVRIRSDGEPLPRRKIMLTKFELQEVSHDTGEDIGPVYSVPPKTVLNVHSAKSFHLDARKNRIPVPASRMGARYRVIVEGDDQGGNCGNPILSVMEVHRS